MRYTKGPWKVRLSGEVGNETQLIAAIFPWDPKKTLKREANAKLIASAPELLEACKNTRDYFEQVMDADDGIPNEEMNLFTMLQQAIAKAEGK